MTTLLSRDKKNVDDMRWQKGCTDVGDTQEMRKSWKLPLL